MTRSLELINKDINTTTKEIQRLQTKRGLLVQEQKEALDALQAECKGIR